VLSVLVLGPKWQVQEAALVSFEGMA
jgi:hypothetical protein